MHLGVFSLNILLSGPTGLGFWPFLKWSSQPGTHQVNKDTRETRETSWDCKDSGKASGFLDLGRITYDIVRHMKFCCINELWNYPWSPLLNEEYTNYTGCFILFLIYFFLTNSFQVQYLGSLFYLVEFLSLNRLSCAKHALTAILFSLISILTL